MRFKNWFFSFHDIVNEFLEFGWISINFGKFFSFTVSNVFEAVNFTEIPKIIVEIMALSLYSVDLSEIYFLRDLLHHLIDKLWF